MCSIDWCAFTWDAFATLVTGLAVAVGATVVGLRQVEVMRQQARIQEGQAKTEARLADMEELKLKLELFQRRQAVYDVFQLHAGRLVNRRRLPTLRQQIVMGEALRTAKHLFGPAVHGQLKELLEDLDLLATALKKQQAPDWPDKDQTALQVAEELEARAKIGDYGQRLDDIMGEYLNLALR